MMEIKDYIAAASLILSVIALVAGYLTYNRRAMKSEVETHNNRLITIETQLKSLPSKDAFHRLELDVTEVKGNQRVLEKALEPIARSVGRIETWLLDEAKDKTRSRTR